MPEEEDPVPYVTKKHFEYAIRESRRSVSDADLLKYESFSQKMKQQRGSMGSGVANFSFPDGNNVRRWLRTRTWTVFTVTWRRRLLLRLRRLLRLLLRSPRRRTTIWTTCMMLGVFVEQRRYLGFFEGGCELEGLSRFCWCECDITSSSVDSSISSTEVGWLVGACCVCC